MLNVFHTVARIIVITWLPLSGSKFCGAPRLLVGMVVIRGEKKLHDPEMVQA